MRRKPRETCQRLGAKLLQIRAAFKLTPTQLIDSIGMTGKLQVEHLEAYEQGRREPTALTLLRYARLANVRVEVLIDDALDLPVTLPRPKTRTRASVRKV